MQTTMAFNSSDKQNGRSQKLRDKKVREIITPDKRRLVEVPYTASLADTMNAVVANRVAAVPVVAPPGQWIGAGGSMILESDKQTGAVRKHYIGMVTMLDLLAHIAGDEIDGGGDGSDLHQRMAVPVSSIIGHCLESLSLWTLNPNTSIPDCMEVFSKGIHRALVPLDSHMENVAGVELVDSASTYRMLTQMDLLRFLKAHDSELEGIMSRTVGQLGGLADMVFGVTHRAKVIEAIKCMRTASLSAIPIVEASNSFEEDHSQLINGRGRKLVGTFSATDLRGCPIPQMRSWLNANVLDFTNVFSTSPSHKGSVLDVTSPPRELVTCHAESLLGEVIDEAVSEHVHRVWVVDRRGMLDGLVSLTDMIRVIRVFLLSESS